MEGRKISSGLEERYKEIEEKFSQIKKHYSGFTGTLNRLIFGINKKDKKVLRDCRQNLVDLLGYSLNLSFEQRSEGERQEIYALSHEIEKLRYEIEKYSRKYLEKSNSNPLSKSYLYKRSFGKA